MTPITALIDADMLVYECAHANEQAVQFDESTWVKQANGEAAFQQLRDMVEEIQRKLRATRVIMCLSDYTNPWRKQLWPDYKAHRKVSQRPMLFEPLREFIAEAFETFQRPGLEADDVLGILLTNPVKVTGEKIVVSDDKDMLTLPGLHITFRDLWAAGDHGSPSLLMVSPYEADSMHMWQTLVGDRVDGYPGCPGVGRVKAQHLLTPFTGVRQAWPIIVAAYEKAGQTAQDALRNAQVARICRHEDYDYKNKRVIPWTPPTP